MSQLMQKAIKEALLELLEKKAYSEITVKDITDICQISRSSFYYHFNSLEDVLSQTLKDDIDRIIAMNPGFSSFEECMNTAVDLALQHRKACVHIYQSVNQLMYERYLMQLCEYTVKAYGKTIVGAETLDKKDAEIMLHFIKCEMFGQVIDWLEKGAEENLKKKIHRFCQLNSGWLEMMIKNSKK